MSHKNYTPDARKNKHLTERERYTIEILLKERMKPSEIAKRLGRHIRTIEREIQRGLVQLQNSDLSYRQEYCADTAQRNYYRNARNKGTGIKIGNDHKLAKHIEDKIIKEKYSPDAVIGEIKVTGLEFKTSIDNGSEFLDFKGLERSIKRPEEQRVKIYYAHPYSSWERGTNENINKLIRRFIPKGTDIGKISKAKVKYIEQWINNYPRRIFGYKCANDLAA